MEERRGLPCFLTSNEEEDGREKIVSDITQVVTHLLIIININRLGVINYLSFLVILWVFCPLQVVS